MTTTRKTWADTEFKSGDHIAWPVCGGGEPAIVRITGTGSRYESDWSVMGWDGHSDLYRWPPTGARLTTPTEVEIFTTRFRPAPANWH